jgi:hypothetical protein
VQLLAGNDLAGVLRQNPQHAQWLRLNFDRTPFAQEFSGAGIQFEIPETQPDVSVDSHSIPSILSRLRPQME